MVDGKILSFQIDVRGESEGAKRIAELDQSLSKLNQERREALKLSKESDAQAKKRVKGISALNAKISEGKRERTKLIAEEKRLTKAYQAGDGSVTKLRLKLQATKTAMEKLNLTTRAGQREFKRLNAQYQQGSTVLRKYDQRLSGSTRLQGAFTKGIISSFKSMAVGLIGITALIRVFRSVIKVVGDFDTATAKLASVTGKTREEIEDLTDQSKELGAVTQFTANQVATLQIELAKLGFTANEISLSTPAILSFATATGANLAAAAKTAGAAVRIFGLSASETGDAVATLAVATTKSGLTFEHFDTILSTAGPVAKAYGFELADVIALTGELATKGFEANKAATATRNILLNLADANGELAKKLGGAATDFDGLIDGLIRADAEGISLAETLQLTDKRSVAAFSTFLEGAKSARELRDGIVGVNDELDKMVEKQLDTLAGDMDLLTSAWQGFIFATGGDVGPLRFVIQFLTNLTLKLSNLGIVLQRFNRQSGEELARSFDLLTALTDKQGDHFSEMIQFFDDLGDEKLLSRGIDQMAKDFALIRGVNRKEGLALAQEYLKRREEVIEKEVIAEGEKQERILKQEADARKKSLADERLAQAKRDKAIADKSAKERAKEQEELNAALARTVSLLASLKAPEELENLVFNIVSGEFSMEDIEADIMDLGFLNQDLNAIILKANIDMTDSLIENTNKRFDNEDDRARQTGELIKQIEQEKINLSADGANEVFNIGSALLNRKQAKLEEQLKNEQITEEKFAEEKAKLRRKQALVDKVQALFNIALNTAIGVSNAASKVVTLPLVPFIIALGALQAIAVAAEPPPEFAKGGIVDYQSGGKVKSGYEMPWSTPQGDNTLALVKPREVILNESQQSALGGPNAFRRIGVPGFAVGGVIGSPQPPTSSLDLVALASAFANSINDLKVIQNINELHAAENDLAVINSTNPL